jgi:hypothetical protein
MTGRESDRIDGYRLLSSEVGWREALRLAGLDPRELSAIGLRGWLKITALLAVCWAAAWLLF